MEGSQGPLDGLRPEALSAAFYGEGYAGAPELAAEPPWPQDVYRTTIHIPHVQAYTLEQYTILYRNSAQKILILEYAFQGKDMQELLN